MIEEVTRYQTKDGRLHMTREQAESHIVTTLENKIGPILDATGIRYRDRLAVAKALFGSIEHATELQRILATMI